MSTRGRDPSRPDDPESYVIWRFRVPRAEVVWVRMVVEAEDGVAVVATPDPKVDLVEWWIPPGREPEAEELAARLGLRRLE